MRHMNLSFCLVQAPISVWKLQKVSSDEPSSFQKISECLILNSETPCWRVCKQEKSYISDIYSDIFQQSGSMLNIQASQLFFGGICVIYYIDRLAPVFDSVVHFVSSGDVLETTRNTYRIIRKSRRPVLFWSRNMKPRYCRAPQMLMPV